MGGSSMFDSCFRSSSRMAKSSKVSIASTKSIFGTHSGREQSTVPLHCLHGKRGDAHRDVFGAFRIGRAVADPLALVRDHGLAGADVDHAVPMLHAHRTAEHDGELVELWGLSRFAPSGWTAHVCDAGRRCR